MSDEMLEVMTEAEPVTVDEAQPSLVSPPDYDVYVPPEVQAQVATLDDDEASAALDDPLVWMLSSLHHGGVVVDQTAAQSGACYDFDLGDGKHVSLHDGVLYPLNAEQEALFCLTRETMPVSDEMRLKLRRYVDAATTCTAPAVADDGAEAVLQCMARELKG